MQNPSESAWGACSALLGRPALALLQKCCLCAAPASTVPNESNYLLCSTPWCYHHLHRPVLECRAGYPAAHCFPGVTRPNVLPPALLQCPRTVYRCPPRRKCTLERLAFVGAVWAAHTGHSRHSTVVTPRGLSAAFDAGCHYRVVTLPLTSGSQESSPHNLFPENAPIT